MNDQLVLLDKSEIPEGGENAPVWELDEHTRDVGRRGVAQARQALRQAAARAA